MGGPTYGELLGAAEFVRRVAENHAKGDPTAYGLVVSARSDLAQAYRDARRHARMRGHVDIEALAHLLLDACMATLEEVEGRSLPPAVVRRAAALPGHLETYQRVTS
jgi:hypothetical protein